MNTVATASSSPTSLGRVPAPNPQAVSEYCRYLAELWLRANPGRHARAQLAEVLGITRVAVHQLEKSQRGAGAKLEAAFARVFCDGSIDRLRIEAEDWWSPPPERLTKVIVAQEGLSPNRDVAARFAREIGIDTRAVVAIEQLDFAITEDVSIADWLDLMRAEELLLRLAGDPGRLLQSRQRTWAVEQADAEPIGPSRAKAAASKKK